MELNWPKSKDSLVVLVQGKQPHHIVKANHENTHKYDTRCDKRIRIANRRNVKAFTVISNNDICDECLIDTIVEL